MNATAPIGTRLFRTLASAVLAMSGCATTAPQATFTHALPADAVVAAGDVVTVTVAAQPGVVLTESECQRLAAGIAAQIDAGKGQNAVVRNSRTYRIAVLMTRYDKGDAFARFMLAGLGQIHIDAQVSMVALPRNAPLAAFTVKKTFAWGGVYGASQSIEDVEEGFGKAVAEAVTKTGE